jgi:hypothetical protein
MLTTQTAHRKDINAGKARLEHRHFATIAAILRALPDRLDADEAKMEVIRHFADELEDTNPNFNRDRFFRACLA